MMVCPFLHAIVILENKEPNLGTPHETSFSARVVEGE